LLDVPLPVPQPRKPGLAQDTVGKNLAALGKSSGLPLQVHFVRRVEPIEFGRIVLCCARRQCAAAQHARMIERFSRELSHGKAIDQGELETAIVRRVGETHPHRSPALAGQQERLPVLVLGSPGFAFDQEAPSGLDLARPGRRHHQPTMGCAMIHRLRLV